MAVFCTPVVMDFMASTPAAVLALEPSSLAPLLEPRKTLLSSVFASERSVSAEAPPAVAQLRVPEPLVERT